MQDNKAARINKMEVFGISMDIKTDPVVISDILKEDLMLDDLQTYRSMLGNCLNEPVSLKPMLENIKKAIIEKQPQIQEFLKAVVNENLLPQDKSTREYVIRTLHYTYLLDILTKGIYENPRFDLEVRNHLMKKRSQLGISNNFIASAFDIYKITGSVFSTAKTLTMDYRTVRADEIKKNHGKVSAGTLFIQQSGLALNIIEAMTTEKLHGYNNNALTGVALAINPFKEMKYNEENNQIHYLMAPEWCSLYETWNLAFITGNMDNLDILYPKLLIPQVIGADSDKYITNRGIALWASINFYLFRKVRGKQDLVMPGSRELATRWGEINIKYAREYVKKINGTDLNGYNLLFTMPLENLKNKILNTFKK